MTSTNEKAVLFIGANRPIPGKEQEWLRLWTETGGWLDSQMKVGWFAKWDGCWLTAHGGDLNSMFIVWGDRAKLDEWRRTETFEAWLWRAQSCTDGLGVVPGASFPAAKEQWERHSRGQ